MSSLIKSVQTSLIQLIGSHTWSLFAPNSHEKLIKREIGVESNMAQNHSSNLVIICPNSHTNQPIVKVGQLESVRTLLRSTRLATRKSYLVIICPNSHGKLTKGKCRSSWSHSNISQNQSSSPQEIISGHYLPNSHKK